MFPSHDGIPNYKLMGKRKVFKFSKEELTMYNTLLTGAVIRVILDEMSNNGLDRSEIGEKYLPVEYLKNHFQNDVEDAIDDLTGDSFDLSLFEYEEECEGECE